MKNSFVELALDEVSPAKSMQLLAELNDCPACSEEYAAIRSTLHVSSQALRSALPLEDFWTGYHSRLHSRLLASDSPSGQPAPMPLNSRMWLALTRMATTSVRVPVPAAIGLVLLLGVSVLLLRSRNGVHANPPTQLTSVETRTINVPVIQEKVVTRVVYLEKRRGRSRRGANQPPREETSNVVNSVAKTGSEASARTALRLIGFKPTDQIKLTIIKGNYQNEK